MTDHEETSGQQAAPAREWRALGVVLLVLAVIFAGAVGAGVVLTAQPTVAVPSVVGQTPVAASRVLAGAKLRDGSGTFVVTRSFPAGRIQAQSPAPLTEAVPGSAVSVDVAVEPTTVTVPDLGFVQSGNAEQALSYVLLKPLLLYAYSKTVETDRVIEQLPRSGDSVYTGSSEAIVVSLGPGTGGKTVPPLMGLTLGASSSILASETLFPMVRAVTASGVADGTIVDQVPSAGSTVPATSQVVLSLALSAKP